MRIKDGLGAHPIVHPCVAHGNKSLGPKVAPAQGDTTCKVTDISIPTAVGAHTEKVPVGARFTIDGETAETIHVVMDRTQGPVAGVNEKQTVAIDDASNGGHLHLTFKGKETDEIAYDADAATVKAALVALDDGYTADDFDVTGGPGPGTDWVVEFKGVLGNQPQDLMVGDGTALTGGSTTVTITHTQYGQVPATTHTTTDIVFSPALGAGTYGTDADITFLPQQLEVKIGEGNITYTEHNEYEYLLDRDNLDTVKEGKEVPMDLKWDSVYEHITTGTGENISPMDALKGIGGSSEWITYAPDPCEPYAVALEVAHVTPCGTSQGETTLFPNFRSETREINFKDATISVTGKCNATAPIVTRQ